MLHKICSTLEQNLPYSTATLLQEFDLLDGHPWSETARAPETNYYACLHAIARTQQPKKILEVGVAFGMSSAALIQACETFELYVGVDLGIFGGQYNSNVNNVEFAKSKVHAWCNKKGISTDKAKYFIANSQPPGSGDNTDLGQDVPRWNDIPELVQLLSEHQFDIIFVDGKHTGDGLLNDLRTFWQFLKPGGLAICDDLHDAPLYPNSFSWAGDTVRSFETMVRENLPQISEFVVWNHPGVPPVGHFGRRPFGLIRKCPTAEAAQVDGQPMSIFLRDFCKLHPRTDTIILPTGTRRVWIDVGAHEAETSMPALESNEDLCVIAFEPLPDKWRALVNKHPRLIALPYAVSPISGVAEFNRTANNASSSLRPFDDEGLAEWKDIRGLEVTDVIVVPTIRLDTVISRLPIDKIEFLKIDAQGCDLDVIKSADAEIQKVQTIKLEVAVTENQLYVGASSKEDAIRYMKEQGYMLSGIQNQTNDQEQNLTFVKENAAQQSAIGNHPSASDAVVR